MTPAFLLTPTSSPAPSSSPLTFHSVNVADTHAGLGEMDPYQVGNLGRLPQLAPRYWPPRIRQPLCPLRTRVSYPRRSISCHISWSTFPKNETWEQPAQSRLHNVDQSILHSTASEYAFQSIHLLGWVLRSCSHPLRSCIHLSVTRSNSTSASDSPSKPVRTHFAAQCQQALNTAANLANRTMILPPRCHPPSQSNSVLSLAVGVLSSITATCLTCSSPRILACPSPATSTTRSTSPRVISSLPPPPTSRPPGSLCPP